MMGPKHLVIIIAGLLILPIIVFLGFKFPLFGIAILIFLGLLVVKFLEKLRSKVPL